MQSYLKPELTLKSSALCLYRVMSDIHINYWQYVPVDPVYISWIPIRKIKKEVSPELIYPITEDWKPYSESYLNECFSSSEVAKLMELLTPFSNLNSMQVVKHMLPLDGNHMGVEMCWGHNAGDYLLISLCNEFGKDRIEQVFNGELHDIRGIIRIPESLENYNNRMNNVKIL
ncbi:MAG: hypothetical protein IPI23_00955 [Bacteroidetes bacterium]|nr:hypothetical protein [Bacteroidota bacterium]